jgi:hypothetical protein
MGTAPLTDTDEWTENPVGPGTNDSIVSAIWRGYWDGVNNRVRWLFNRIGASMLGEFQTFAAGAVDAGTDTINIVGHGIPANTVVRFGNVGGAIFGPLVDNVAGLSASAFYVLVTDVDNIQLSLTSGGAAIDLTSAGTGTHYIFTVPAAFSAIMHPSFTTAAGGTIPAGTLLTLLTAYYASTTGATFSGAVVHSAAVTNSSTTATAGVATHTNRIVLSGAASYLVGRTASVNDAAAQTISGVSSDIYYVPDVSQNSTYTVTDPAFAGLSFVVSRRNVGGGFAAEFRRDTGAVLMGTLPNTGASWIRYTSHAEDGALAWHAEEWGGNAANLD